MPNLILIGFSYTGKSTIGRAIAAKLGWPFIDIDDLVVERAGQPIPELFATAGEAAFRSLEKDALREACSRSGTVIAAGGGAVTDPENRRLMAEADVVVCLEARPEAVYRRMKEGGPKEPRPLLEAADPLAEIERLKAARQPFYALADWTVHTDILSIEEVAVEVLRGYALARRWKGGAASYQDAAYVVATRSQSYPGYAGWGILDELGPRMRGLGLSGAAYVVADRAVFSLYGRRVMASLKGAGFAVDHRFVEPGEASKSLESARDVYDWLAQRRAERGHCLVALGGGMAGDLAGFVAATYLRGMPFVQVPTTLLAMVDASIGGKVAVNLPAGKNLVGSFWQPRLVLADVQALATLPERELTAGWAEVVKHALILDPELFSFLQANVGGLRSLDPELATEAVRRSAAIKARVVSLDERETEGLRILLNYGHTVGHALEAAAEYQGLLHGEAVAVGMAAASHIAHRLGILDAAEVEAQRRLLEAFGLPQAAPEGVDPAAVRQAMELDKKVAGKTIHWVLLEGIGRATVRSDVPAQVVEEALQAVGLT